MIHRLFRPLAAVAILAAFAMTPALGQTLLDKAREAVRDAGEKVEDAARDAGRDASDFLADNPDLNRDILDLGKRMGLPGFDEAKPYAGAFLSVAPAKAGPGDAVMLTAAGLPGSATVKIGFGASAQASPYKVGVFPSVNATYAVPLTKYDTTFLAGYRFFKFTVVEDPFRPLNIQSETQIFTLSLRQPVYRTLNDELALALVGEYEQNANVIGGNIPFDFVNGMKDGFGNVAALRFIQEWTHRTTQSVFAVRSRFTAGLDLLGATVNGTPGAADGQFVSWLGQAEWLKRFESTRIELVNFLNVQWANDHVFPLEQIAVGADKLGNMRAAHFLLAFQQHDYIAWQPPVHGEQ